METEKTAYEPLDASNVGLDAGDVQLDEHGREIPDPVPLAPPVGYRRQPSLVELVRDMVRSEGLRQAAMAEDKDDFETFDNFDIPDDPSDPHSPWENDFDPPISELVREGDKAIKAKTPPPQPKDAPASSGASGGGDPPADKPKA